MQIEPLPDRSGSSILDIGPLPGWVFFPISLQALLAALRRYWPSVRNLSKVGIAGAMFLITGIRILCIP